MQFELNDPLTTIAVKGNKKQNKKKQKKNKKKKLKTTKIKKQ